MPDHSDSTTSTHLEKKRSRDYSGVSILAGNAFTIILALVQGWDLGPLLVIYWAQSVIIGIFNIFRMLKLRQFCTDGFTSNGKPVPENAAGKRSTAGFFAVHYGFFHFGYAVFLLGGIAKIQGTDWLWLLFGVLAFLVSHAFSFVKNVADDLKRKPNLGTMMFLPYLRIIPMHLTIIIGGALGAEKLTLLLFLLLKTGADYAFHIVEHRILQKSTVDP